MNKIEYGTEFLDQLKDSVHDLYDENKELKKEIERLNKENKLLQDMDKILRNENTNLKLGISKAIEYLEGTDFIRINEYSYRIDDMRFYENMYKILKGEDNE